MEQTPLAAAWRFRWLVLFLTVLGGGVALVASLGLTSTQYEATASLIVTDPRASTLFGAADAARLDPNRYLNDQISILQSDSVTQSAADLADQGRSGPALDPIEIAENVRISTTGSNEILVQYAAPDDATAVAIVNSMIEAYGETRHESAFRESASAIAQLDTSITEIDNELTEIEQQMADVRNNPIRLSLDDQFQAALTRLADLQPRLKTSTGDRLTEIREEIGDIDSQLATFARIIAIEEEGSRLVQLDREQAQAVSRRGNLAAQRDQLLVDTELLSGGISQFSPAQFALEVDSNIATLMILGALLGLLAGASIAYLLAVRRRRFVERSQPGWVLRTALLAEIPSFSQEGFASQLPVVEHPQSVSAESFRFAATSLDLQITDPEREANDGVSPVHSFLVTSAGPGAGKTVLTANLALAAAREGRRVLVIDGDFGNQELSKIFHGRQRGGPGITEVVEAGLALDSATVSLGPPGTLDLLERGQRPATAPDFWSLPASKMFVENAGKLYDVVLIDGPPMLHVAYASILARYVDKIIAVVPHASSVKQLEDMSQRLDLIGTPVAGYVYNAAPLRYELMQTEGSLKDVLGDQSRVSRPHVEKHRGGNATTHSGQPHDQQ